MLKTSSAGNPELGFLRALNAAISSFATFAPEHVRCADCIRRLFESIDDLRAACPGDVAIRLADHVFELGASRLASRNHGMVQLEERFQSMDIRQLSIAVGVTREELRMFLQVLIHRLKDGAVVNLEHEISRAGLAHISIGNAVAAAADAPPAQPSAEPASGAEGPRQIVPKDIWSLARPSDDTLYWRAVERVRSLSASIRLGQVPNAYGVRDAAETLIGPMRANHDALLPAVFQPQEADWELTHAVRSAVLAMRVGLDLTDDETSLRLLGESALLHDIGLFTVPPEILHKAGPLEAEERALVRRHTIEGAKLLLMGSDFPPAAVEAALLHHWCQTPAGYPEVSETSTPSTVAKIIKIVDAYESIIGSRPYRRSRSPFQAAAELIHEAGVSFDRAIVGRFVRTIGFFPVGSMVRLSDGSIAQVRGHDPTSVTTPAIAVLIDAAGEIVNPPKEVDLKAEGLGVAIAEGLPFESEPLRAAAC